MDRVIDARTKKEVIDADFYWIRQKVGKDMYSYYSRVTYYDKKIGLEMSECISLVHLSKCDGVVHMLSSAESERSCMCASVAWRCHSFNP